MRIGSRLFPYPLLNHEKLYSNYKDVDFSLKCVCNISENNFVLNGLSYETNSDFLKKFINESKVKVFCVIECPQTMFRKTYEIFDKPFDLSIPLFELSGKTKINAFAVALNDLTGFESSEFIDDYNGYSFDIEKNDILAVDDGFIVPIDFNTEEDTKKSSIFLILKDKKIKDEIMNIEFDANKITVNLPVNQWDIYDRTKKQSRFDNLYFSIIAIPALTYALGALQKSSSDVDQLCNDYRWFNSFRKKYEEINKKELTDEDFSKMNPCVESQRLLNTPNTKSISDICDFLVMPNDGGNEND